MIDAPLVALVQFKGFNHNSGGAFVSFFLPLRDQIEEFRKLDSKFGIESHVIDLTATFSNFLEDTIELDAQLVGWGEDRTKGVWFKTRIQAEELKHFESLSHKTASKNGDEILISIQLNQSENSRKTERKIAKKGKYGALAQTLHQSSFFRTRAVLEKIGSDNDYNQWIKRQKSALSGEYSEYHDDGSAYCVPAHYREVSDGAGVGIKPKYATIPLTHAEHLEQHQKGYIALGGRDWFKQQRAKYIHLWGWETLKERLGFDSWSEIEPRHLLNWATNNEVDQYLPSIYREHK